MIADLDQAHALTHQLHAGEAPGKIGAGVDADAVAEQLRFAARGVAVHDDDALVMLAVVGEERAAHPQRIAVLVEAALGQAPPVALQRGEAELRMDAAMDEQILAQAIVIVEVEQLLDPLHAELGGDGGDKGVRVRSLGFAEAELVRDRARAVVQPVPQNVPPLRALALQEVAQELLVIARQADRLDLGMLDAVEHLLEDREAGRAAVDIVAQRDQRHLVQLLLIHDAQDRGDQRLEQVVAAVDVADGEHRPGSGCRRRLPVADFRSKCHGHHVLEAAKPAGNSKGWIRWPNKGYRFISNPADPARRSGNSAGIAANYERATTGADFTAKVLRGPDL